MTMSKDPSQAIAYLYQQDAREQAVNSDPLLVVQAEAGTPPDYPANLYRLYFIEAEATNIALDHRQLRVEAGQLLALSPTEQVTFDKTAKLISLGFHHDFFCVKVKRTEVYCDGVVFNRISGQPQIALPEQEWPLLRHRFEELREIVQSQSLFTEERAINSLRSLLLQAADYKLRHIENGAEEAIQKTRISDLVLQFQDLLEKHYLDRKDSEFFSDQLGVTPAKLNRHLKAELGQTVLQAINERIAIAARVELRSGQKSVKEVAIDLGFEDPLYFSRFFKKQFGSSPSYYFTNPQPESNATK